MVVRSGAGGNLTDKTISLRDIWRRRDLAPMPAGAQRLQMSVGGMDSLFLRLAQIK